MPSAWAGRAGSAAPEAKRARSASRRRRAVTATPPVSVTSSGSRARSPSPTWVGGLRVSVASASSRAASAAESAPTRSPPSAEPSASPGGVARRHRHEVAAARRAVDAIQCGVERRQGRLRERLELTAAQVAREPDGVGQCRVRERRGRLAGVRRRERHDAADELWPRRRERARDEPAGRVPDDHDGRRPGVSATIWSAATAAWPARASSVAPGLASSSAV